MTWYQHLASFFAGAFLANFVPHFVNGVSGERFPTPFSKPPGKGLSSAPVNTVWALANLVVGYLLFRVGNVASGDYGVLGVFFAGIAVLSLQMSAHFTNKDPR